MTPRRRNSSGSNSSSPTRPNVSDSPTRRVSPGNGDAATVNLGALDAMTVRLNNTGGRVEGVGRMVGGINVGPQSMGIVGGNFTGSAQNHLQLAKQHVDKAKQAVHDAQAGTRQTVQLYRDTDQGNRDILQRLNPNGDPPRVNTNTSTTPSSTSRRPPASPVDTPPPPRGDTPGNTPTGNQPSTPSSNPPSPPASIADRLNPAPDPNRPYQPSTRERYLQQRSIVSMERMGGPGNVNETYRAQLDDGTTAVYKPESGEVTNTEWIRNDISGDLGRREMAASRVDDMFGFGRVPATTMLDGPHGPGSVQMFAEGAGESRPADSYPRAQQQQMAVLDYVTGNTDRHSENYMTGPAPDHDVIAIDHGFCFPEGQNDPIRSDFVRDNINQPLDPSVVSAVRAVDPDDMRRMLQDSGLNAEATERAVARLEEIQRNGMITGEAHGRYLTDGSGVLVFSDYYDRR